MKQSITTQMVSLIACASVLSLACLQEGRADPVPSPISSQSMPGKSAKPTHMISWSPMPDQALVQAVPKKYQRSASDWQTLEKRAYEKMLSSDRFDVLVVPLQVSGWSFDKATRSLMTAKLSAAIAHSTQLTLPDPFLVARALGDGQRTLDTKDVHRLANLLRVKRIVWGHVGHNREGKMTLVWSVQTKNDLPDDRAWSEPGLPTMLDNIGFSDEYTAIQAYESRLPDMLKSMAWDPVGVEVEPINNTPSLAKLPATPKLMLSGAGNSTQSAYSFLLLAALTPHEQERTKERFAEKAYLASANVPPSSPDYRAIRARALMTLGHRLAALKELESPVTDEERALVAALNGNLPDVRVLAATAKDPLKRLLQKLDANRISASYQPISSKDVLKEVAALKLPGDTWNYLVTRAFRDPDAWSQYDNIGLKMILDNEMPIKGYGLKDLAGGVTKVQNMSGLQDAADLAIINHARKLLDASASPWCCKFPSHRPSELDYLDLVQSIGHDNLMRRIGFYVRIQGNPEGALRLADSLDPVYKGYPSYVVERARAENALAKTTEGAKKDGLLKAAYAHAFDALYWEQGQSRVSNRAYDQISETELDTYGYYGNYHHTDIPFRPYYLTWADGGSRVASDKNDLAALKNATTEFHLVDSLLSEYRRFNPRDARGDVLLKSVEGRFIGAPARNTMLAHDALQRGDVSSAKAYLRDNIKITPDYWGSYELLGKTLIENGDPAEAAKVYAAYPGFKRGNDEDRVGKVNRASEAGSNFYWAGEFTQAKPFYEIAAAQGTGAGGEMASALRLKLLEEDIDGAMVGSLQRAQRYNDTYAYRDLLGMLHAKGESSSAWTGFSQLVRSSKRPHVWETALVGHHMAGAAEAGVVTWAQQPEFLNQGTNRNASAVYLLRFATTDRTPSSELPDILNALDHPLWQLEDSNRFVVRLKEDGSSGEVFGPQTHGFTGFLPLGNYGAAKKHRVQSDLAYFAKAYTYLKQGKLAKARETFDEAATYFDFSGHALYMLPYYALVAAKTGDVANVERILATMQPSAQRFDYYLARAAIAGSTGKPMEALDALVLARYRRPYTEERPLLTQATFGEMCELIAQYSGSDRIRALAVEWAQKSQKFEPWQSWSYALEAKLNNNPQERQRAIAMTHYLDRNSERLSTFSKNEIDLAVKAHHARNPFLKPAGLAKKGPSV